MTTEPIDYPANWANVAADFDHTSPTHLMQLKGKDYMPVQKRMLWFIRDQRAFIKAGLATTTSIIETRLVELDRERGFAHFSTYVRDVLGNEATMYGSESAKDFGDYAEKASTKSLGRALLALGYGTAFAPEMDEGERVVDSPRERQTERQSTTTRPRPISTATIHQPAPRQTPALTLANDHIAFGTTAPELAQLAANYGIVGEKWGALFHKHKGALPAIHAEIRAIAREVIAREVEVHDRAQEAAAD